MLNAPRLPLAAMHTVQVKLVQPTQALTRAGVPQRAHALTATACHGSWFHYAGASNIAFPMLGSALGQQVGDVVFNLVMVECVNAA
eukprot:4675843-Pyramimonas_sp.AAC.1